MSDERFLAKTDKYEVIVEIAPCGLDRSITLNGVNDLALKGEAFKGD